ncbi:MAG: alpha/beta hydrolase [Pseudomonadota bacterium]
MGSLLTTVALAAGAWLLANAFFYVQQPAMVFYPYAALEATPADWGLDYEDVEIGTEDGVRLHGWYLPSADAEEVLLFFHGNAGNISHRRASLEIFHELGLDVLIIDYRGYGRSEGAPDEAGLYADAVAAWRYLTEERGIEPERIILFGRSLGASLAARLASQDNPGGLILESSFSSAGDIARRLLPLLSHLFVMRYSFDTERSVRDVRCPVLVLHSPDDEIIPYVLGRRVYDSAPEPKTFVELTGDHNSGFLLSQPGYSRALDAYIQRHVRRSPAPDAK